jgi:hypothetical protein
MRFDVATKVSRVILVRSFPASHQKSKLTREVNWEHLQYLLYDAPPQIKGRRGLEVFGARPHDYRALARGASREAFD